MTKKNIKIRFEDWLRLNVALPLRTRLIYKYTEENWSFHYVDANWRDVGRDHNFPMLNRNTF